MDWIQKNRTLLIVEGMLFTILGLLSIAMPVLSTLSAEIFIGWLLIFGGAFQFYRTFQAYESSSFFWSLITSSLYIVFGILLLLYPLAGMFSLTILLIGFFIAEGVGKIILSLKMRPRAPWGYFLFSGIIALILAFIIWSGWPNTALWTIGSLFGIYMVFFGISLLFLAYNQPKEIK